jgi:ELWxxDGT repeat protein
MNITRRALRHYMALAITMFSLTTQVQAQSVQSSLVKDIYPGSATSNPEALRGVGNKMFFFATDDVHNTAPWISDGTAAGTFMIKDMHAIGQWVEPDAFLPVGDRLIFNADSATGAAIWITDGTDTGTHKLSTAQIGNMMGGNDYNFAQLNNKLYFCGNDHTLGNELWLTDGTTAGTQLIADIWSGTGPSDPRHFTAYNGAIYFTASDSSHGQELWHTDGTPAGTYLVKDIYPGVDDAQIDEIRVCNGKLYFGAADGTHGREPWVSDGTGAGTMLLKDISPDIINGSEPYDFAAYNGLTYFGANDSEHGTELWVSDGTTAGTHMLKEIFPGSTGSNPGHFTQLNGKLIFSAADVLFGAQLWQTDGSAAGTVMIKNMNPYQTNGYPGTGFMKLNNKIYMIAADSLNGTQLWVTDGTTAGTQIVTPQGMSCFNALIGTVLESTGLCNSGIYYTATYDAGIGQELYAIVQPNEVPHHLQSSSQNIFTLYPNPATNVITILANNNTTQTISICNTLGQQLITQTTGIRTSINISALPTGIYYAIIGGNVQKFVKK